MTTPYPPGPGLPLDAPSVYIVILGGIQAFT
jgi:hypothetical protein